MPPKNGGKETKNGGKEAEESKGKKRSNSKEPADAAQGASVSKRGRPSIKEKFVLSEANLER